MFVRIPTQKNFRISPLEKKKAFVYAKSMFGLGLTEILIVVLVAFLVFGPEKFPSMARNFLKFINELKASFSEVQSEFHDLENELQKEFHDIKEETEKDFKLLESKIKPETINQTKKSSDENNSTDKTKK